MDMNQTIRSCDIEFMTTYPRVGSCSDEKVLLIIGKTYEGYKYLIYAPRVLQKELTIEQQCDRLFGTTLGSITTSRTLTIDNKMYAIPNDGTEVTFSFFFLDKQPARHIKKENIEKLFGCVIDG